MTYGENPGYLKKDYEIDLILEYLLKSKAFKCMPLNIVENIAYDTLSKECVKDE